MVAGLPHAKGLSGASLLDRLENAIVEPLFDTSFAAVSRAPDALLQRLVGGIAQVSRRFGGLTTFLSLHSQKLWSFCVKDDGTSETHLHARQAPLLTIVVEKDEG